MESRCRLCAIEKFPSDFACTIKDPTMNIRQMLIDCCRWSTFESSEYESLPKNVCMDCLQILQQSWRFADSVARAQQQLLSELNAVDKVEDDLNDLTVDDIDFQAIIPETQYAAFDLQSNENEIKFADVALSNYQSDDDDADGFGDFDDVGKIKSDEESIVDEDLLNNDVDVVDYNEMSPEFKLLEHITQEERRPDGTIAPEAIQRLRLHDWTFVKYCCYICDDRLPSCTLLKNHLSKEHPKQEMKQFCMLCSWSNSIAHAQTFARHITKHHLPYLEHCCTMCGLYFWDINERKKHGLKRHNDYEKRLFLCETCGQEYTNREKYETHRRSHMPKKPKSTNVRTYECYLCKAHFQFKKSAISHMWKHAPIDRRPHVCTVCGGKFTRLMSLRRHSLIHAGQTPFTCNVCGKGFRAKANLTVHYRIHTGEKPYACTICDYRTTDGPNLNKHMLQRHQTNYFKKTEKEEQPTQKWPDYEFLNKMN